MPYRKKAAVVQALLAGIDLLATVVTAPMADHAVRLKLHVADRPTVWLDPRADDEDLARGLLDVLRILAEGPEAATSAERLKPVRHLHAVGVGFPAPRLGGPKIGVRIPLSAH